MRDQDFVPAGFDRRKLRLYQQWAPKWQSAAIDSMLDAAASASTADICCAPELLPLLPAAITAGSVE